MRLPICEQTTARIRDIIRKFMDNVMERRLVSEPWNAEQERISKPFHFALAPELVWKGSKFERSLVTTMGRTGFEQIAAIIAKEYHGEAQCGKMISGQIKQGQLTEIQGILDSLEHKTKEQRTKPNWEGELKKVLSRTDGKLVTVKVITDLFVLNQETNTHYYIELKSPKPNSDQTKVSKEKMLKLAALHDGSDKHKVYFALPFNPYGQREKYVHPYPKRWFNMVSDEVVIMGRELWDLVGGPGTYEYLLKVFEQVGSEYRPVISRDYFGL